MPCLRNGPPTHGREQHLGLAKELECGCRAVSVSQRAHDIPCSCEAGSRRRRSYPYRGRRMGITIRRLLLFDRGVSHAKKKENDKEVIEWLKVRAEISEILGCHSESTEFGFVSYIKD